MGVGGVFVPISVENGYLAEGTVDVALDDVARVVKDRRDIIVAILNHTQVFAKGTSASLVEDPKG